ncbi:hypothetical protein AB837_00540 [bacterium AB1]|nr:hypothetical protein AB837_00540 [bacterium AB1]
MSIPLIPIIQVSATVTNLTKLDLSIEQNVIELPSKIQETSDKIKTYLLDFQDSLKEYTEEVVLPDEGLTYSDLKLLHKIHMNLIKFLLNKSKLTLSIVQNIKLFGEKIYLNHQLVKNNPQKHQLNLSYEMCYPQMLLLIENFSELIKILKEAKNNQNEIIKQLNQRLNLLQS